MVILQTCNNLILIHPLLVLKVRGAEAAHDHSAKKNVTQKTTSCAEDISCKQWPCWSTLDKVTITKTPTSCTWAQELQLCTPCSRAGGDSVGSSGLDSSFEVTLDQTGPHLRLASTKRKPVCLLQAGSTAQARRWSLTRLEPAWSTNTRQHTYTRSSAVVVCSTSAAIVLKLHAYHMWAEISACAHKYPFICREIFLGFRLGVESFSDCNFF